MEARESGVVPPLKQTGLCDIAILECPTPCGSPTLKGARGGDTVEGMLRVWFWKGIPRVELNEAGNGEGSLVHHISYPDDLLVCPNDLFPKDLEWLANPRAYLRVLRRPSCLIFFFLGGSRRGKGGRAEGCVRVRFFVRLCTLVCAVASVWRAVKGKLVMWDTHFNPECPPSEPWTMINRLASRQSRVPKMKTYYK